MNERLSISACMPEDRDRALLVGRAWMPAVEGPAVVCVRGDDVYDLSPIAATASAFFELDDPVAVLRDASALPVLPSLAETLANSAWSKRDNGRPALLTRAVASAICLRDRQLVAVATAHLRGDSDRTLLLARDHLAEHPDSLLVAHIAALSAQR